MEERIRERYMKYQEEQEIRLEVTFEGFDSDYSFDGVPYARDDIYEPFRIKYSIEEENETLDIIRLMGIADISI
ncbi:hypothetical protein [Sharpea azabuensis]|uniref:hypothetical protein n=1 Tax=Sharpea azabuensis TaxID=322505 RepID=UPI003D05E717